MMKRPHVHRPTTEFRQYTPASSSWRTRGYLPHFDEPGRIQAITFRLIDSLPRDFLNRCERELQALQQHRRQIEKEKRISKMLDRGIGGCHLRDPRVASVVENALLFFDTQRYNLWCWCIMPNHVHSMIETFEHYGLDKILHSWKSYTSNQANRILGRRGALWQQEYHDRFIRDDDHHAKALRYIENNPVKAGLVAKAEDWRWSSAWRRRRGQLLSAGNRAGSRRSQRDRGR